MRLLPVLLASLSFSSFGLISSNQSLSANLVAQLGGLDGLADIENATIDILGTLGYDCQTAGALGIACTKCSDKGGLTQKCKAYICDSVTRKCRKQEANLPSVPDSVDDLTDDVDIDSDGVNVDTDDITDDVTDGVNVDTDDIVDDVTDDIDVDTDNIPGL